jgi:uncharacterized protein
MPGKLSEQTLKNVLGALPLDITYVDGADIIRYYSNYRIFNRTPEIIGTTVQNCHPPASRPEVERVLDNLRSGRKTVSEFTSEKNGRKVKIRYVAVRDEKGKYTGMVETAEWAD